MILSIFCKFATKSYKKFLPYRDLVHELKVCTEAILHISSDIIESDFGIYKAKKSSNKLYGITSPVHILPLYPRILDYSIAFKVRLANVKLKDIDL